MLIRYTCPTLECEDRKRRKSTLYEREQTLRRQVEELKIVIDEGKRQKQVEEIVDSEFFHELKVKAQQMRAQQNKNKPGDQT